MKLSFLGVLFFALNAFSASLPLGLNYLATWSTPLGKSTKTYIVTESQGYLVAYATIGPVVNTDINVSPETAFVLTDKEVETLNKLLPEFISEKGELNMVALQGLDDKGNFKDNSDFNWALQFKTATAGDSYVGNKYSQAPRQTLQLIVKIVESKSNKTLKAVLTKK